MKFAHIADVHLGAWKEPRLRELSTKAFIDAFDSIISEKVDFVILAGDLFNTSLPSVDSLKLAIDKLKELKAAQIPCYVIAGSHDFSPSGKTMLDVLEKAELLINIGRGVGTEDGKLRLNITQDPKTGVKIAGMLGKKGGLERSYYDVLDRDALEQEDGYKIFMLHTALTELTPKGLEEMDSCSVSVLPKGFDYYAAGHVHHKSVTKMDGYGPIVFTGPLFPNNFKELEAGTGGYFIVDNDDLRFVDIPVIKIKPFRFKVDGMTAIEARTYLDKKLADIDIKDTLVLLRIQGTLKDGKIKDMQLTQLLDSLKERGAYFVMKNTAKLQSTEYDDITIEKNSVEDIERSLLKEQLGHFQTGLQMPEEQVLSQLMQMCTIEKREGETNTDFEQRLCDDIDKTVGF